jgi:hypothetical protein
MRASPAFFIRQIPVYGRAILSPMDGFSDLPFRLICRELGSAMSYTEFVNVDELLATRKRDAKCWRKLVFHPGEQPMTYQIYGHDVDRLVTMALRLQDLPARDQAEDVGAGIVARPASRASPSAGPGAGCCAARTGSRPSSSS